jgi:hypothetical protein
MISKRSMRIFTVVVAGLIVPAVSSAGDLAPQGYAACTGVSFGPDQFQAGLHFQLGPSSKPQLRPVLELGLGNGVRLISLSGDVLYHFEGRHLTPYAGAGPGLNLIDVTDGVGEADGITARLVAHAVAGLSWTPRRGQHRYFLEGRIGVGDTPNFRLAMGMSF